MVESDGAHFGSVPGLVDLRLEKVAGLICGHKGLYFKRVNFRPGRANVRSSLAERETERANLSKRGLTYGLTGLI